MAMVSTLAEVVVCSSWPRAANSLYPCPSAFPSVNCNCLLSDLSQVSLMKVQFPKGLFSHMWNIAPEPGVVTTVVTYSAAKDSNTLLFTNHCKRIKCNAWCSQEAQCVYLTHWEQCQVSVCCQKLCQYLTQMNENGIGQVYSIYSLNRAVYHTKCM